MKSKIQEIKQGKKLMTISIFRKEMNRTQDDNLHPKGILRLLIKP